MPYSRERRSVQLASFVVLRDGDRALFVKQSYGFRNWALPGGMVDPGESAWDAAIREAREETGLEVELTGLASVVDRGALMLLVHTGIIVGGTLNGGDHEIDEIRWFSAEELANLGNTVFVSARKIACSLLAATSGEGLGHHTAIGEFDGSPVRIYGNL